jgi:hypothetical protein
MSKPGNYTAYQQYKPLNDGTTQALQQWSNFYEQKRQNDIAQEQRDKALANDKEKEDRAFVDGLLKLDSIKATGVKSVDELNADIGAKTYEERTALVEKLITQKPGTSDYLKTMALLNANGNIPKEINGIKNAILENAKKYTEGRNTSYTVEPYLDDFYKNLDNSEIVIDPQTQKAVVLVQDPEDATKKISLTYQDILNGKGDFKLTPKINFDTFVKENAKILNENPPTKDRKDEATGYILTEEGYEEPTVEQIAKNMFSDSEGNPTEYAISFSKQKGIYDLNQIKSPENLAKLEKEFITDITPFLVDKNKIKTNTNKVQEEKLAAKIANDNRKLALGQAGLKLKERIAAGKRQIKTPITSDSFTVQDKELSNKAEPGRRVFGVEDNSFIINNEKQNTQEVVQTFSIDPNNSRSVVVKGYKVSKDDEGVEVETPFSYNSENEPNNVLRFTSEANKSVVQMHKMLMDKAGLKYPTKPKAKSTTKPKAKETLEERKKRLGLK